MCPPKAFDMQTFYRACVLKCIVEHRMHIVGAHIKGALNKDPHQKDPSHCWRSSQRANRLEIYYIPPPEVEIIEDVIASRNGRFIFIFLL